MTPTKLRTQSARQHIIRLHSFLSFYFFRRWRRQWWWWRRMEYARLVKCNNAANVKKMENCDEENKMENVKFCYFKCISTAAMTSFSVSYWIVGNWVCSICVQLNIFPSFLFASFSFVWFFVGFGWMRKTLLSITPFSRDIIGHSILSVKKKNLRPNMKNMKNGKWRKLNGNQTRKSTSHDEKKIADTNIFVITSQETNWYI